MIKVFESYVDAGQQLPQREKEQFYTALLEFIAYGVEPSLQGTANAVFTAIRPSLELSKKRAEAGRVGGGAHRKSDDCLNFASEQNESKTQANEQSKDEIASAIYIHTTNTSTSTSKGVGGMGEGGKPLNHPKPSKHRHGEFGNVLLTDDEFSKLKERFPADWQKRIDDLDIYVGKTGKKYKSHYLTIISWARSDADKNNPKTLDERAIEHGFGKYNR